MNNVELSLLLRINFLESRNLQIYKLDAERIVLPNNLISLLPR